MTRRLVLVGLMVLLQGSMLQIIIGTVLSAIFLLFQVQASPFKSMGDDFLASACSFFLVIFFVCAYAFRSYEFVGLPDIRDKMSLEQEQVYVVNQTVLTLIIVGTIFGALFVSSFLFFLQLGVEGARMRREARSRKARRLRDKKTGAEVVAPLVPTGSFHIFLSHVSRQPYLASCHMLTRCIPLHSRRT